MLESKKKIVPFPEFDLTKAHEITNVMVFAHEPGTGLKKKECLIKDHKSNPSQTIRLHKEVIIVINFHCCLKVCKKIEEAEEGSGCSTLFHRNVEGRH